MKITRAMELIAASRIVKAQQRVMEARPYADLLTAAMEDVARQTGSMVHPLLEEREAPSHAGVLVMTSDRGLAGAFNANLLKRAEGLLRRVRSRGLEPVLYLTGKKAIGYFRFRGVTPEASWSGFSEVPRYEAAQEIVLNARREAYEELRRRCHAAARALGDDREVMARLTALATAPSPPPTGATWPSPRRSSGS